ncbi:RluA family pseudouridine synthase [Myxococcota bacterium]|nr:RluA family pseudouridine synthase [Myxococcota bacterium]
MFPQEDIAILYEDDDLIAVYKPSGLLVHRGIGRDRVTLTDLLRKRLKQTVYLAHRLDRATSGILLVARHKEAAQLLNQLFMQRQLQKHYVALVRGVAPEQGLIDRPLTRDENGPRVPSFTAYRRLARGPHRSIVEAVPFTGRLHQLRRHLGGINHPIIGDRKRGDNKQNHLHHDTFDLKRMALHAFRLRFPHPVTQEIIDLFAPVPLDMLEPIAKMSITPDDWPATLFASDPAWVDALRPADLHALLANEDPAVVPHPSVNPDTSVDSSAPLVPLDPIDSLEES